tara:strand:- start:194 stop:574 length:381 start_codon:yes stop_codon:yes gene_type:complete
MSINFSSPASYLKHKFNSEDISKSATAGDTRVENAILYGNANLLKAMDAAETLEKTAGLMGSATEYTGSQYGLASAVGGIADGISTFALGYGKSLGGGGGGPEGAPPSGAGGSDTDVRSWLTPNVP